MFTIYGHCAAHKYTLGYVKRAHNHFHLSNQLFCTHMHHLHIARAQRVNGHMGMAHIVKVHHCTDRICMYMHLHAQ